MKTILSIPLFFLILFTGIRVDIGTHYCGGSVAATKISLKGELASCGMEQSNDVRSTNGTFSRHCCDDTLSEFTICNNYIQSTFSLEAPVQTDMNHVMLTIDYLYNKSISDSKNFIQIRPPGLNTPNSVAIQALCIFRI